ncbi:MAG TPA: hypothetical protein VGN23_04470 [Verrucomicrobiae bacterium]|jgi:hypothetical protein
MEKIIDIARAKLEANRQKADESCFHSSRGQRPRGKSMELSSPCQGIPLKPKNEKTKPNYFRPFLIANDSSITTNQTHALKVSLQKRSQIRPERKKSECRMKKKASF